MKTLKVLVSLILIAGISLLLWFVVLPHLVSQHRVDEAVSTAERHDLGNGYCFDDEHDWWGGTICIKRDKNERHTAIAYTAIAPGRDRLYDTEDDYTRSRLDFNKSKIAGQWAGNRAKEFAKGIWEGVKAPNRHEN